VPISRLIALLDQERRARDPQLSEADIEQLQVQVLFILFAYHSLNYHCVYQEQILNNARAQLDNDNAEIQHINHLANYAKCAAERERQIQEKVR